MAGPLPDNARHFINFRIFFNARFYYPVLAVLFVDLGLTLEQYALLNVAWAGSIVLLELPLGALGDQIGRRPLVVLAGAIMVVEMAVLSFFDSANAQLLFYIFLANRFLSGAAEAAASGADEALAYDSMVEAGREDEWPRVLANLGRRMSVAMFVAMIVGGAVYDFELMQTGADLLGLDVTLDQRTTARFPIYLCFLMSLGALYSAWRMTEPSIGKPDKEKLTLRQYLRGILDAGLWIARTKLALAVVLLTVMLDSVVRLFLTVTSTYYRLVDIPPMYYGVLGSAFSLVGFAAPTIAMLMVKRKTPKANYAAVAALILVGLGGIAFARAWWGALIVLLLGFSFHLVTFFASHYLNAVTESSRRATVLSFKSLFMNVAYGGAGWLFALAMRRLAGGEMPASNSPEEASAFSEVLVWIPIGFAAVTIPLVLWACRVRAMRELQTRV